VGGFSGDRALSAVRRPYKPSETQKEMRHSGVFEGVVLCKPAPSVSLRDSRWGRRAERVGEASNPGPPDRLPEVRVDAPASPTGMDEEAPRTPDRPTQTYSWHTPEGHLPGEVAPSRPEAEAPPTVLTRHSRDEENHEIHGGGAFAGPLVSSDIFAGIADVFRGARVVFRSEDLPAQGRAEGRLEDVRRIDSDSDSEVPAPLPHPSVAGPGDILHTRNRMLSCTDEICNICLDPVGGGLSIREAVVRYQCCHRAVHQGCLADVVARGIHTCPNCRLVMQRPLLLNLSCATQPPPPNDSDVGRLSMCPTAPIMPPPPLHVQPICCSRVGPPPDFQELPDRSMEWAPTAQREGGNVVAWIGEWMCRQCSGSLVVDSFPTPGRVEACERCYTFGTWVWDQVSGRGEWRCASCRPYYLHDVVVPALEPTSPAAAAAHAAAVVSDVVVAADADAAAVVNRLALPPPLPPGLVSVIVPGVPPPVRVVPPPSGPHPDIPCRTFTNW
jgi:hypothetical protein